MFFWGLREFPPTRPAPGGDLGAGSLRKHPGQGASLLQAAGEREGTDWVVGCHTLG